MIYYKTIFCGVLLLIVVGGAGVMFRRQTHATSEECSGAEIVIGTKAINNDAATDEPVDGHRQAVKATLTKNDAAPNDAANEDDKDNPWKVMVDRIYTEAHKQVEDLDRRTWTGLTDSQKLFLKRLGWDEESTSFAGSGELKSQLLEQLKTYSPDKSDITLALHYHHERSSITYGLIKALKGVLKNKKVQPAWVFYKAGDEDPAAAALVLVTTKDDGTPAYDVNRPRDDDWLAIGGASTCGYGTLVALLMALNADPHKKSSSLVPEGFFGDAFAAAGNDQAILALLGKPGARVDAPGQYGFTARHFLVDAYKIATKYIKNPELTKALETRVKAFEALAKAQAEEDAKSKNVEASKRVLAQANNQGHKQGNNNDKPEKAIDNPEQILSALKRQADKEAATAKVQNSQSAAGKAEALQPRGDDVIDDGPGPQSRLDLPLKYLLALEQFERQQNDTKLPLNAKSLTRRAALPLLSTGIKIA